MQDVEFLGDTLLLLRNGKNYDPQEAYELVKNIFINKI